MYSDKALRPHTRTLTNKTAQGMVPDSSIDDFSKIVPLEHNQQHANSTIRAATNKTTIKN